MRNLIFTLLLSTFFIACHTNKEVAVQTVQKLEPAKKIINTNLDNPTGKWSLRSFSAFMPRIEGESYPKYEMGDVVWDFGDERSYDLIITKKNPEEKNEHSLAPGEYRVWTNQCMMKINDKLFMFSLSEDELVVDSNYDPSYGADLPVLRFTKMK